MRRWFIATLVLVSGCAGGRSAVAPPEPEVVTDSPVVRERVLDRSSLERAEDALSDGDWVTSWVIADSLWREWTGSAELDPESAEDLVGVLDAVGAEERAASVLVRAPFELRGGDRKTLRNLVSQLSIRELQGLMEPPDARVEARSIVGAELARALAVADHPEMARQLAETVLAGSPDGTERNKAEDVLEGRVSAQADPLRIGLVLPATGRFAGVGEQILEGALLALELYRADPAHAAIDLVVLDDSSRVEVGIDHVEALGEMDVAAVIGPIRTEALQSAAIRRDDDDLLILSPTAAAGQGGDLNVYTLWDRDRREADVAVALASWLSDNMDLDTLGVLYPYGWSPVALEALRAEVAGNGGRILAAQPYVADSTTFGTPIAALAAAEPAAVVVFADNPRTVLQIAPQLVYYGLRRWVTAGDANWSDPAVVRRLDPSYSDHRLVGTYVDRISAGTPWRTFEAAYEAKYRKALTDNMFAALGFDALNLILAGVPEVEWERRGAIGRSMRSGIHQGATGSLGIDPVSGTLGREVFVRVLEDGGLSTPDAEEMLRWAEEQMELEEFLRALEEEKEEEEEGDG
ncbi:MAG: ABC transporter substrate-binding protein [marine benthic group bacterium]|nr:ABC transporter substrate-binding protein [Gemmatimonadota bacterium]